MKSMNSGTPASVALPDRSSLGMIMLASMAMVAHSWGVKNFGLYGVPVFSAVVCAVCACVCASCASASVHTNPAAAGAAASSRSSVRRSVSICDPSWNRQPPTANRDSDRPGFPRVGDEFSRPHRQREYRPREVLVGLGRQWSAVGDEEVLHIVRLAVLVEH